MDIVQLNGAMLDNVNLYHGEISYKEPLLMFRNTGKGHFEKVSDSLGPDFVRPVAGRGLATADFDNDGDIDIAVNNRGDYPELLRNDGGNANHWLEVLLIGTKSNRDAIGSVVRLTANGQTQTRVVRSGSSYLSQSELPVVFGVGREEQMERLTVEWPNGKHEEFNKLKTGKSYQITESKGITEDLGR